VKKVSPASRDGGRDRLVQGVRAPIMPAVEQLKLWIETQVNPVADEVSALTAVVRPILLGVLYALKQDIVAQVGGFENVTLEMLARLYRPKDGDCGICFEYAVHDAVRRAEPLVIERVVDALDRECHLPGKKTGSILFGAEKAGSQQLIDTAKELLTDDSLLMYGTAGRPVKLKRHLSAIAGAFRKPDAREQLPPSISGLWKADLFLGHSDTDRWVGTTVKINPTDLEWARGLRIGIVPAREGGKDAVRKDERRNLVVCPLPHDGSFMEVFYGGWGIVRQFIAADAKLPKSVNLPRGPDRQVARSMEDRRKFPVVEVVKALEVLAQPELLETRERDAELVLTRAAEVETGAVVAPVARTVAP
jgi:hypothetical protein